MIPEVKTTEFGTMLTCDPRLQSVIHVARNVASSRATVLISGESGTGKELLAKFIHEHSPRASKRLVAINCAAVPEGLLESELFGFERGAFTGAVNQKVGKFEIAHDSTILLDEISEMPLLLQAKLLRVLQEEEIDRLGGRQPIKINVRIIATTNRDLRQMVAQKTFREDLFYRLNVIPLVIPPLRERPADLALLAEHFTKVSAIMNGREAATVSASALQALRQHSWPGNVRELENVIERAVLLAQGPQIQPEHIVIETSPMNGPISSVDDLAVGMTVADAEKTLIMKTLTHTRQNRTQAARLLGISIRTLRNKLREYREVINVGSV